MTTAATPAVDNSNKDAAHEAAETPEQAAAEKAGTAGGGRHGPSNTDAAHEAAESPAHVAEEAARDAALANGTTSSTP